MTWHYLSYLLQDALGYFQQLQLEEGLWAYNLLGWLVIRLSPNVEPSKALMAVINFWFKCPSWSLLLLERAEFTLDMTSLSQQGSCWKDPARVEFTFTCRFGHVSLVAFTMCGNPNQVISTGNSPQPVFRCTWPVWLYMLHYRSHDFLSFLFERAGMETKEFTSIWKVALAPFVASNYALEDFHT